MQEVTSTETKTSTIFDQLRSSALVDTSSRSRAFSDFLGLMAQPSGRAAAPSATNQINTGLDAVTPQGSSLGYSVAESAPVQTAATALASVPGAAAALNSTTATTKVAAAAPMAATTATNAPATASAASTSSTSSSTGAVGSLLKQNTNNSISNSAKNAPVSRAAFEEAKPLLVKAGYTDKEIADLSARVQAGTLSWGQLVQNLGGHMTGAKKAVALSATETADLQVLFQKMGFAGDVSAQMAQSMAKGDGLKVLSSIQNKLSTMPDDSSLGMDKNELATFFKALRLPTETANKLTQALGPESTVADLKNALATMSQAMQDQRAKTTATDTELAKNVGKIMEKDTAKSARDTAQSSSQSTTGSSATQVSYELKTKDKNDTGWFDQREKAQQEKTQQQKASDDSWKGFNAKVRTTDETILQSAASGGQQATQAAAAALASSGGKESSIDALARAGQNVNAQQGKAEISQQAKAFEKVTAPKVLDQVSEAMLKDLGQGRKQLTVQLDPENLGKVQVLLQVKGKEVSAIIQTEDAQTAAMLSSNMESLKKTLEDQGLTVQNLEVQAGLTSRQDQQASFNADQHNQAQERQELSRIFSQLRMMRDDTGDMAPDMQNMHMQAILADQGLHIIA